MDYEQKIMQDTIEQIKLQSISPNYEAEYYRLQELVHHLQQENENLKKALVNIALKL